MESYKSVKASIKSVDKPKRSRPKLVFVLVSKTADSGHLFLSVRTSPILLIDSRTRCTSGSFLGVEKSSALKIDSQ